MVSRQLVHSTAQTPLALPAGVAAATVGLGAALCRWAAELTVAGIEVAPPVLDVLLAATQGAGAQVQGDVPGQWRSHDDPQQLPVEVEVVVARMERQAAGLLDLGEGERSSDGASP